jgi:hypothetical protein
MSGKIENLPIRPGEIDHGSVASASTSIQKQSPAGASQWGFVFEYLA